MVFKDAKCDNCGMTTKVDDSRKMCYCIYCGFRIENVQSASAAVSAAASAEAPEGMINVKIVMPGDLAAEFDVTLDGNPWTKIRKGEQTLQATPGTHTVRMQFSYIKGEVTGELTDGCTINVIPKLTGLKLEIVP